MKEGCPSVPKKSFWSSALGHAPLLQSHSSRRGIPHGASSYIICETCTEKGQARMLFSAALPLSHFNQLVPCTNHQTAGTQLFSYCHVTAEVGVNIEEDMMFVSPQADTLFARTREEITELYPFPMLPTHFLDRDPANKEAKYGNFLEFLTLKPAFWLFAFFLTLLQF